MELSLSPSTPNGVCLASFLTIRVYQWDHEASSLAKGTFQINPLNMQLPVRAASRHKSSNPEQQQGVGLR